MGKQPFRILVGLSTALLIFSAGFAAAQDTLPFPDPPMGGKVGPTMFGRLPVSLQAGVGYWDRISGRGGR